MNMTKTKTDIAVAVYNNHTQAEDAVKALQRAGFDMKKISIIGRDYHTEEHVVGFLNAGDRAKVFGKYGAFWGGLMGVLFGSAMLFVPVVGHVIVLGPLAATLFGGLEGAVMVGGISALAGALMAVGIPKDSVLRYETALKADKFMLVVHGGGQEIMRAKELLQTSGLASFEHHPAQDQARSPAHA
ncbi:MAG: general stress protein [Burkholderiales bacterium]|nr:general stress protein [Burkholderiales bacterium]